MNSEVNFQGNPSAKEYVRYLPGFPRPLNSTSLAQIDNMSKKKGGRSRVRTFLAKQNEKLLNVQIAGDKIRPQQLAILERQERAVKYLYLDELPVASNSSEVIVDPNLFPSLDVIASKKVKKLDTTTNPLTDILTLIATGMKDSELPNPAKNLIPAINIVPGLLPTRSIVPPTRAEFDFLTSPQHLALCVKGKPVASNYLWPDKPADKAFQRATGVDYKEQDDEFRTVHGFKSYKAATFRGLYAVAHATERNPLLLKEMLEDYSTSVLQNQAGIENTALGILEILNSANLLTDLRFSTLTKSLRLIVLQEIGKYDTLRRTYFYGIVRDAPFWAEGEAELAKQKQVQANESEVDEYWTFPSTDSWKSVSRAKNKELETRYEGNHLSESFKTNVLKTGLDHKDKLYLKIQEQTVQRELDRMEKRREERRVSAQLTTDWGVSLAHFTQETKASSSATKKEFLDVTKLLLHYFRNDPSLYRSLKAADSSFLDLQSLNVAEHFEVLLRDPLVNWVFDLRDEDYAGRFREGIMKNPESFYTLLKLSVTEIGKTVYGRRLGKDFLFFKNSYGSETSPESLLHFFEILRLAAGSPPPPPDAKTCLSEAQQKWNDELVDLLPEPPKQLRKRVKQWYKSLAVGGDLTRRPIFLNSTRFREKARKFTRTDVKVASALLASLAVVGGADVVIRGNKSFLAEKSEETLINMQAFLLQHVGDIEQIPADYFTLFSSRWPNSDERELQNLLVANPRKFGEIVYQPQEKIDVRDQQNFGSIGTSPNFIGLQPFPKITEQPFSGNHNVPENQRVISLNLPFYGYKTSEDKAELAYVAPYGWKVVEIYQTQGTQPVSDGLGNFLVFPRMSNSPTQLTLVLEKFDPSPEQTINIKNLVKAYPYSADPNPDPSFHKDLELYGSYYQSLLQISENFYQEMIRSKGDETKKSELTLKYLHDYTDWVKKNTYQSLDFHTAQKGGIGEYDSIGLLQEILYDAGVTAFMEVVLDLKADHKNLVSTLNSLKLFVELPDGTVFMVDSFPPVVEGKTPPEDVNLFREPDSHEFNISNPQDLLDAVKTGASLLPAIYGLKLLLNNVSTNEAKKRIKNSLLKSKQFSAIEDKLTLSTLYNIATKSYTKDYPKEVIRTLNHLQDFSFERHGLALDWLTSSPIGKEIIANPNPHKAFVDLSEYAFRQDITKNLPGDLQISLKRTAGIVIELESGKGIIPSAPPDFVFIHQLGRLIREVETGELQHKVLRGLNQSKPISPSESLERQKKLADIRYIIEQMFARGDVPEENAPYFNALYSLVTGGSIAGGTATTPSETVAGVLSDTPVINVEKTQNQKAVESFVVSVGEIETSLLNRLSKEIPDLGSQLITRKVDLSPDSSVTYQTMFLGPSTKTTIYTLKKEVADVNDTSKKKQRQNEQVRIEIDHNRETNEITGIEIQLGYNNRFQTYRWNKQLDKLDSIKQTGYPIKTPQAVNQSVIAYINKRLQETLNPTNSGLQLLGGY